MMTAVLWMAVVLGSAPTSVERSVGASASGVFAQLVDAQFTPVRYQGLAGGAGVHFERRAAAGLLRSQLSFVTGTLANRYGFPLLNIDLVLAVSYEFTVHRSALLEVLVGPALGGRVHLHQFQREDSDHAYWLTAYDLGPRATLGFPLSGGRRVAFWVELPLLAFTSRRPAYPTSNNDQPDTGKLLAQAHQNMALNSLDAYQSVRAAASIEFPLAPCLRQRFTYLLAVQRQAVPQPLTLLSHALSLTLEYTF